MARKYRLTAEQVALLREAYTRRGVALSRYLDLLVTQTGLPRYAFTEEAQRLGLARSVERRPWTDYEVACLVDYAGDVPVYSLARRLKRSVAAVQIKARLMGRSARVVAGYSVADLVDSFGVRRQRVEDWLRRGLLGRTVEANGRRVSEAAVMQFIRRHPHEYDLARVDQVWFKAMFLAMLAKTKFREE
jgi:hypothetical protein